MIAILIPYFEGFFAAGIQCSSVRYWYNNNNILYLQNPFDHHLYCVAGRLSRARLSISFRFAWNGRNIPYQFKKRNKTEQFSSHFKSRSVPDFSAKFRSERSGFIPHVPFRSWKAIESNWILFNLIN